MRQGMGSIKGFTILELLIVITMMVLLSTVTLYVYINTIDGAKRIEKSNEEILQTCAALVQMEKQLFLYIKQKAVISSLKREGYLFILTMLSIILLRVLYNVNRIKSKYTKLVVYSFTIFIIVEYFLNISMSCGLIPIVGVPLPLFSYGGSSYLTTFIMFAIINRGIDERDRYW